MTTQTSQGPLEIAGALLAWKPTAAVRTAVRIVPGRKVNRVFLDISADADRVESIEVTSVPTAGELRILEFAARQVVEAAWERATPYTLDTAEMGRG